jgi:hypothetical protein
LALSEILMAQLGWHLLIVVAAAGIAFSILVDQVKQPMMAAFQVE